MLRTRKGIHGPHWKSLLGGGAILLGFGLVAELVRRVVAAGSPQFGQTALGVVATVAGLLLFGYGVRWHLGVADPLRQMRLYRHSARTPNVDFLVPGGLFFFTGGLISLRVLDVLPGLLAFAVAILGLASMVIALPLAFWEPEWLKPRWVRERRRALASFARNYEAMVADETAAIDGAVQQLADGLERLDHRKIDHGSEALIKRLEGRIQGLQAMERPREYQDVLDDLIEADQQLVGVADAFRSAPLQEAHDRRFILGAASSTRNDAIAEISERESTVREFYGRDRG